MGRGTSELRELQDLWKERTVVAYRRYKAAKEAAEDVRLSDEGVLEALQNENAAFKEYERVLRIFNDLVLYHKIPDEEA